MKRIQRSFSTIGLPERSTSIAAIISKIRIIFKTERKSISLGDKKNIISTNQTNNTTNCWSDIIIISCYEINTSEKKNQNWCTINH